MMNNTKKTKIMILSDLHIDTNSSYLNVNIIPNIINMINNNNPDKIIIAGDISNNALKTIKYIEEIENKTNVKIYFIPGNHDVRVIESIDSWEKYKILKEHHSSLIDNPIFLENNYVILGDMGWYDYSFGDLTIDSIEYNMHKKLLWDDATYVKWGMTDLEVCDMMLKRFQEKFKLYKDKNIIFVNHFVPHKDFIVMKKNDEQWNFANGFMGSEKIGNLLKEYKNIKYIIFGHTHKRFGIINKDKVNFICNPLGYFKNEKLGNIDSELEKSKIIINI